MVDAHCSWVRTHMYHPFVGVFDTQNGGQQRRFQVRCAICNCSIGIKHPFVLMTWFPESTFCCYVFVSVQPLVILPLTWYLNLRYQRTLMWAEIHSERYMRARRTVSSISVMDTSVGHFGSYLGIVYTKEEKRVTKENQFKL